MNEYDWISTWYGTQKAERSGQLYMNHINEGLFLLTHKKVSRVAHKAWCIHPIIQSDADLKTNHIELFEHANEGKEQAMASLMAMEYRNIANQYTSKDPLKHRASIALSPIWDVNTMLAVDKVQNYKDAIRYVIPNYPEDAERLHNYFQSWLDALNISHNTFVSQCELIDRVLPYNHNADSLEAVTDYYNARFSTLWDYEVTALKEVEGGVEAYIETRACPVKYYVSFYLYKSCRGRGLYRKWAKTLCAGDRVLTIKDCNLAEALQHMGVPHDVVR